MAMKKKTMECPHCHGRGWFKVGDRKETCTTCNGTGKMTYWTDE
jgi:DnaJ-class molecular chaperone